MSGSEVSTHPKADVQKTKRFFCQLKKVHKKVFWKINKFGTLVRENCYIQKTTLHQKTHRVFFSSQMLVFRAPTAKIGIIDYSKEPKYQKTTKNSFYRSLRKVESFPFFLQFSKYFALPSFHYTACGRFFSHHSKNQFRSPTAKVGICEYKEKSTYPKMAKICIYTIVRKVENFPFFFTVF